MIFFTKIIKLSSIALNTGMIILTISSHTTVSAPAGMLPADSQLLYTFSIVLVKSTPLPLGKRSSNITSGDLGNHDSYEVSQSPRTLKIGMLEYNNNSVGCLREELSNTNV
jgi:hypothetical protein